MHETALNHLENWLHDAMCDYSPEEVHNCVMNAVKENFEYHQKEMNRAKELLDLFSGNKKQTGQSWADYWEGAPDYYDNYKKDLEKELTYAKINSNSPYNDGYTREYYQSRVNKISQKLQDVCMPAWGHSDMEALKYTDEELDAMCDAAEKEEKAKKADKVVRWQLPTQVDGLTGDVFVTFPDDLLETANLTEGDTVEWVDQGDGSYLIRKVVVE
jgi:hypothetical protein